VRPTSGATADLQLTSEIRSFEVRTPDNQALVQISVKLIGERTGRVLAGRIFTARAPVAAIETPNAARALDEALSAAMLDIVRWVSSARLVTPAPAESAASG
jgi:cholesterol transport system auxiliary component